MAAKFGGMNAKDRMAMFEKKPETPALKKTGGLKKVGKLNVGSKPEPKKEEVPFKKNLKHVTKKTNNNVKEKNGHHEELKPVKPKEEKQEAKPVEIKLEPEVKPEVITENADVKDDNKNKEPIEAKIETKSQPEPKIELKPDEVKPKPDTAIEFKAEDKPESKPETKSEDRPETKSEIKPDKKPETKTEPKPETKNEAKPGTKPEPKPETKTEPKTETKAEPKPETKPEPKPETKPEPKPGTKPEPKPENKPEPKPETKPEAKTETRPEAKVAANPEVKAVHKPEAKNEAKAATKPEPKAQLKLDTKVAPKCEAKEQAKPVASAKGKPEAEKGDVKKPVAKKIAEDANSKDIAAAEAAVKAAQEAEAKVQPKRRRVPQYKPVPEEFYDNLFYFSGMGTVVGSAMNQGVYVPSRSTKTALGTEVIEEEEVKKDKEIEKETYCIRKARNQAIDLAEELRKLKLLLGGMPTFGENDLHKLDSRGKDNIMHAHYFQPEHPPEHTRKHEVIVSLQTKALPMKKAAEPQWPPPGVDNRAPEPQWPPPIVEKRAPVAHAPPPPPPQAPTHAGVGVFLADRNQVQRPTNLDWQNKYGSLSVEDVRVPQPFGEGEIPSGLKPWELSRLRGLEAKGYHFEHQEPRSGADYSDDFYHGAVATEMTKTDHQHHPKSTLAPFLVSTRSQSVDREEKLGEASHYILPKKPVGPSMSPRPLASLGHSATPSFHGSHASIPFSDL